MSYRPDAHSFIAYAKYIFADKNRPYFHYEANHTVDNTIHVVRNYVPHIFWNIRHVEKCLT
jgi:hypothetical protein